MRQKLQVYAAVPRQPVPAAAIPPVEGVLPSSPAERRCGALDYVSSGFRLAPVPHPETRDWF